MWVECAQLFRCPWRSGVVLDVLELEFQVVELPDVDARKQTWVDSLLEQSQLSSPRIKVLNANILK